MLVQIIDRKISGTVSISNKQKEQEFLNMNPTYTQTDFNFVESFDLYEYDEVNNTFNLVTNWEVIKSERIAQLEAEIEAQRIASLPTLEKLKELKIVELNNKVNAQHKAYLSKYPEIEIESFKEKARETALVIADNNIPLSQTPYLAKLIGNTTIEARNSLAFAIDVKIQETAQVESYAVNTRDLIKACETAEELEAIIL